MRDWQVQRLGDPDQALGLAEVAEPLPEPGEVVIEVQAAALNFFDILLCRSEYQERPELPFTPGGEISGAIQEVGESTGLRTGPRSRAAGTPRGSPCPNRASSRSPIPCPSRKPRRSLSPTRPPTWPSATGRNSRLARHYWFTRARAAWAPPPSRSRRPQGRVIAMAGGREKVEVCRDLGADIAIDYREENFVEVVKEATEGRGAEVAFDPVGGDVFDGSRRCVAFDKLPDALKKQRGRGTYGKVITRPSD